MTGSVRWSITGALTGSEQIRLPWSRNDFRAEGAVNGAAVGDLDEALAILVVQPRSFTLIHNCAMHYPVDGDAA
jgi:hypothetical protein